MQGGAGPGRAECREDAVMAPTPETCALLPGQTVVLTDPLHWENAAIFHERGLDFQIIENV